MTNTVAYKLHWAITLQNRACWENKNICAVFWGLFGIVSERFMFFNMHRTTQQQASLSEPSARSAWTMKMFFCWCGDRQQPAHNRSLPAENTALTSLTPPAAYRWASTSGMGTQIQGTRDQHLWRAQKLDTGGRVCVCVCVCLFPKCFDWSAN